MKKGIKRGVVSLLLGLLVVNLTACGGSSEGAYTSEAVNGIAYDSYSGAGSASYNLRADVSSAGAMDMRMPSFAQQETAVAEEAYEYDYEDMEEPVDDAEDIKANAKTKLIRTVYLTLRSDSSDLQAVNDMLSAKTEEFGGYIENSEVYNYEKRSNSELRARVPADKADAYLEYLSSTGLQIKSIRDNLEDVTLEYTDIETRKKVLETQRDKYLTYLEQSESITDTLEIEKSLQEVIYELDSVQSRLNVLSNRIIYSTFNISVEYNTVDTTTFWGKVVYAFDDVADYVLDALDACLSLIFSFLLPALVFTFIVFLCVKLLISLFKLGKKGSKTKFGKSLLDKAKKAKDIVKDNIDDKDSSEV